MRDHGDGATNHFEAGGFIRSRAGIEHPDIQYHFLPIAVSYDGAALASEHGYQAHVGPLRSKSRGWVRLKSADPREPPRIFFNYMSHPEDWTEMRACVRLTREIFAQAAFDPYRGREIQPGADCVTDEAIDAFIREKIESGYHPSGACKMGRARRSDGRGRSGNASDRARGAAGGRFLDHALDHLGQSQRADDHDRREGLRYDPRPRSARRLERAVPRRAGLARAAAVTGQFILRVHFSVALAQASGKPVRRKPGMTTTTSPDAAIHEPRRGREARRSARAKRGVASIPYITRAIPTTEILGEEGLALIEHNADTLLQEVGIEFREYPTALQRFKAAGATSRASACAFRAAWRENSAQRRRKPTCSTPAIPSATC